MIKSWSQITLKHSENLLEFGVFMNLGCWNSSPSPFYSLPLCLSLNHIVSGQSLNHMFISSDSSFFSYSFFQKRIFKTMSSIFSWTHTGNIFVSPDSQRESKVKTLWRPCMTRPICTYPNHIRTHEYYKLRLIITNLMALI